MFLNRKTIWAAVFNVKSPEQVTTGDMSKGLIVNGMSCDGCEEIVEDALDSIDGITEVDANHENNTVRIEVSNTPSLGRIKEAVDFAGYSAQVPSTESDSDTAVEEGESTVDAPREEEREEE